MANSLKINPATNGSNDSTAMEQVAAVLLNDTGDDITSSNPFPVRENSFISTENTTTETLDPAEVFTGEWVDILQFSVVIIAVKSNVASATDGLCVEFGPDGSTVINNDCFTIAADTGKTFSFQPAGRYMRVTYTNGGTIQGSFNLETQLKSDYVKPSSHRVKDSVSAEDDAELMKSIITGEDPDGHFHNVGITHDGDLTISDNSNGLAIAKGDVTGTSFIHKFGAAPDFDASDGFVTVTDLAEDNEPYESMQYVYSTSANIDYLSAEDNGDTQEIEVQGLDSNYDLITQTKTLTGQTPVALDTPLIRVFRMKNIGATDFANHIFCYVSAGTTVTNGVPQDGAKVRAVVHNGNNQTEMAVFTIPAGKTGYMRDWYASTAGAKKDSSHTIRLIARPFGQVFQLKHTGNIDVNGTSYIKHNYSEPEKFTEKTDIEIRMNTDKDIAGVAAGFDIVLVDN